MSSQAAHTADSFEIPILFIVFNRPAVTRRVFEQIRFIRPRHLYLAADGPRLDRQGEAELCKKTREIVDLIDWPCALVTKFNSQNLGCRNAVSSAISWFFENVEAGIILEDDCLPDPSFFAYCAHLLKKFAFNERIMHISGDNFQLGNRRGNADYYFSIFNHIWGWATWRRAWQHYDVDMHDYSPIATDLMLRSLSRNRHFRQYWGSIFTRSHRKEIDTWDYQWTYAIWKNRGLSILPQVNLISNIGFGADATHTQSASWLANLQTFPLVIQKDAQTELPDMTSDRYTASKVYGIYSGYQYLFWLVRNLFRFRTRLRSIASKLGGRHFST